jgi:hypothetical protein
MNDIFLTYAREDRARAESVVGLLQGQGWSVWWDRQIPAGRPFDDAIEDALDKSRCVVVLWSGNSRTSHWVRTEAAEGMRRDVLIPALIEDVKVPLEFRRIETVNLADWHGELEHPEARRLVNAVRAHLGDGRHASDDPGNASDALDSSVPRSSGPRTWALIAALSVVLIAVAAYVGRERQPNSAPTEGTQHAAPAWSGVWRYTSAQVNGQNATGTMEIQVASDGSIKGSFTNDDTGGLDRGSIEGALSSDRLRIEGTWRVPPRHNRRGVSRKLLRGECARRQQPGQLLERRAAKGQLRLTITKCD